MSKRKSRLAKSNGKDWFRSWRAKLHSPKVWRLTDAQYRTWDLLLCMTDVNGYLPPISDIAHHMRVRLVDAEQRITDLIEMRFVDPIHVTSTSTTYRMHDWEKWQPAEPVSERVARHRLKLKCNASVTLVKPYRSESVSTSEGRILSTSLSAPTKDPAMKDRNTKGGRKRDASLSSSDEHKAVAIDSGSLGRARDVSGGGK